MSFLWIVSSVALVLRSGTAYGEPPSAPDSVVSLFTIAKSENRNQVQYAIHVDERCVPAPVSPVFAYWRMLQQDPTRTAPLLSRELRAYGMASQRITSRDADGGKVLVILRAVPDRPILVETSRAPSGHCQGTATIVIAGAPAHLFNVYVRLRWPFGVSFLLLRGWSVDGARLVKEQIER